MEVKEESIGKRLEFAVKKLGFKSNTKFIAEKGISSTTFYSILKKSNVPQGKTLNALRDAGINTIWLITGEGEPLLASEPKQEIEYQKPQAAGERLSDQDDRNIPTQEIISGLQKLAGQSMQTRNVQRIPPTEHHEVLRLIFAALARLETADLHAISEVINRITGEEMVREKAQQPRENH